ncbi:MAG: type I DNA topoisomerase, partial [Oscillospiraceae bacterium]|nr:type I DNA topoisomerase [Oscillospiraceae bacterium]
TDPDREGEAISWHLKELLDLPDEKARRVTFNEITKKVVQDGIRNPRDIDQDLVDAQQARRILDRIVGYKLSPLLWRKIRKGLSAGRVQSVATRMVIDRENEIRSFVPEEYWNLYAMLSTATGESFKTSFHGTADKKLELRSEEEVNRVADTIAGKPFSIRSVKHGKKQRSPSPPFITSTLQQEASRRLGMTPRRTMSIAQQLYEGVDVEGEGTVGLITYMRTDSLRLSEDALSAAGDFIRSHYGEEYYYGKPRRYKTGSTAQDAHEAIRPSIPGLTPERVRKSLTGEQYRLYRLIWGRFTASQMSNAVYDNLTIDSECEGYVFRAYYSEIEFPGYTAVYEDNKDDEADESSLGRKPLPALKEGETVSLSKLDREQYFTTPPSRYSEATLIRAMEEKGIGRPSTYAPTITTITAREYVVKEGKYLRPTPLGETVTKLMEERFPDIVDVSFTARMEGDLDKVEEGKEDWRRILHGFYDDFSRSLDSAEHALEGVHLRVPDEVSAEVCPNCGRNLVYKSGRFGRFLACPGYPECSFTMPIVVEMPGKCPRCGGRILKRTSKRGYPYYACEKGAECGFMTWDVPVKDNCPVCGMTMFKLSGKGQRKPFCINPDCENFLPEEKRGYRRRPSGSGEEKQTQGETEAPAEKKPDEGKSAGKKSPAKRTAAKRAGAGKAERADG